MLSNRLGGKSGKEALCVGDGQIFQEDEGKACVRWRNLERTKATNFIFLFFFLKKKKRMMTWEL
jgi:hypothetical protein